MPGRPPIGEQLPVVFTPAQRARIEARAAAEGISLGEAVRRFVDEASESEIAYAQRGVARWQAILAGNAPNTSGLPAEEMLALWRAHLAAMENLVA